MPKHEAYGRRHARFAADPDLTETQGRFATGAQAAPEATEGSDDSDQPLGTQLILLLLKVAMVLGFIAMVFLFLFGVVQVGDESMRPAVREGDLVVYYRLQKDYAAGDLIVVDDGDDEEVRRVIAVEGDEVDFSSDGLLINGYLQSETSIYAETEPFTDGITYPVTVGAGQVFVMGDNRPSSKDSRIYGPVDIDTGTEGEAMTIIRRRNF